MNNTVYTIGHSVHDIGYFIKLLKKNKVNCIIDVRSIPFSRINPQFNKDELKKELKKNGIIYANFAKEFGARQTDRKYLTEEGKVDFKKFRKSKEFLCGIDRVKKGLSKNFNISLMCSEKNPFDCHRFALVSYGLRESNINVCHILEDGSTIENEELEKKLIEKYKISYGQILINGTCKSKEEAVKEGYYKRGSDIAYIEFKENEYEGI